MIQITGRRGLAAWLFAVVTVLAALIAVRAAGGATAVLSFEQLVGGPAAGLGGLGAALPFGYAFAAGMLAAVNPCGFALLPAYLALYLGSADGTRGRGRRFLRAASVAATMSAAFVLSFGVAGLVIGAGGTFLGHGLPFLGLLVGVLLAAAGAYLLAGGKIYAALGDRLAARMAPAAAAGGLRAYAAYGLAYAAASLGCTLPIFLSVVGVAAATSGPLATVGQFLLYGAGMAVVVTALTFAAALFKTALLSRIRQVGAGLLEAITGVLLVLTGAYVTAYWVTLGF